MTDADGAFDTEPTGQQTNSVEAELARMEGEYDGSTYLIPPKDRYTINVEVRNVRKGTMLPDDGSL
jgi:hypothetical protein